MAPEQRVPALEEIVADLRVVRERGLVRLRHCDVDRLRGAAAQTAVLGVAEGGPRAVEALLRAAVENLGGGSLGAAATATFGLSRGARDWPAQDRRRRAADVYGLSVERFRKHHERIVIEQVAEEILKLCQVLRSRRAHDGIVVDFSRQIVLDGRAGEARFPLIVHVEPIEMLFDVDVIVVPQNLYLQLPQAFKSSVSAAVRRAGARRGKDGEIVDDVIYDELESWVRRHGRRGLPVAPGTVVATPAGELEHQGIRRIYHAAITSPRAGTNDYDVEPTVVAHAAKNTFMVARAERHEFDPPLNSIGFPLLGAGRGGLDPAASLTWIWAALEREIHKDSSWEIHIITRRRQTADLIVAKLTQLGAVAASPAIGERRSLR